MFKFGHILDTAADSTYRSRPEAVIPVFKTKDKPETSHCTIRGSASKITVSITAALKLTILLLHPDILKVNSEEGS